MFALVIYKLSLAFKRCPIKQTLDMHELVFTKFTTISIFSLLKIETAKFLKLTALISFVMPKIVINI